MSKEHRASKPENESLAAYLAAPPYVCACTELSEMNRPHDSSGKKRQTLRIPGFSVIVPCYNEEAGVAATIAGLRASLSTPSEYELIVTDDNSSDRTAEILKDLASRDPYLKVIRHQCNLGYGAALRTGIRRAGAELIAIIDADGTYPIEELPHLIEVCQDADMVVGARVSREVIYPKLRRIPKFFLRWWVSWLAGQPISDMNSGMRVFRKSAVSPFMKVLPNGFSFTTTITLAMLRSRYDVRFLPIGYSARVGRSKIRPVRDTLRFIQLILRTGVYFAPLRVFSPLIAVFVVVLAASIIYDLWVLADITDTTILLFVGTLSATMLALLADMIDKRSGG